MTKDKGAEERQGPTSRWKIADFGRPSLDPCQGSEWHSIRKKAQTFALLCLAGLLGWLAAPVSVGAASEVPEVPQLINYSGKLSRADGEPLPTGDYTLSFSIYNHPRAVPCEVVDSGYKSIEVKGCASRVWGPQIFDGSRGRGYGDQVPVVKGFFSAILGPYDINGDPIAQAFTSSERFIEITLEGDAPNLPRQQVLSTPFALRSMGETPIGGIIMFSGKEEDLPENWRVCDGDVVFDLESLFHGKRVPDLRDLFVRGALNQLEIGDTFGRKDRDTHRHRFGEYGITEEELYNYSYHTIVTDIDFRGLASMTVYGPSGADRALIVNRKNDKSHRHTVHIAGVTSWDQETDLDNRPLHTALHYIIRIK